MPGFDFGSFFGNLGGAAISGAYENRNTDKVNQTNKEIAELTNASNERIAQQNLAFQRQNLDYQKALQNQIFEREDTSYQRTVDDMRAAGLSPLSMQNTNGAGSVVPTEAMHNDMQYQGYEAQKSNSAQLLQSAINNALQNSIQRDSLRLQKQTAEVSNAKTQADTKATEAATEAQVIENNIKKAQYEELLKRAGLENAALSASTTGQKISNDTNSVERDRTNRKYQYESNYGLVDGMSDAERAANIALSELGVDTSYSSKVQGLENDTKDKVRKINRAKEAIQAADTALGLTAWFRNVRSGRDVDDVYASGYDGNPEYKHYED